MPKYNHDAPQTKGYNIIHDSFTNAKSVEALQKAVEKSIELIHQYRLDDYQAKRLEEYGLKRFNQINRELREIEHQRKSNRFKKH